MSHDNILNRRILSISESDHISWHTMVEGTLITGAPGSGKSTTVGASLAKGLLQTPRSGALILTAKREVTENWLRYAEQCGRLQDVIVFEEKTGHQFDPLHYEWSRPGRGSADIENIVDFFITLVKLGEGESNKGQSHDPFWDRGTEQLIRHSLKLLELSGRAVSITNIDQIIKTLPSTPEMVDDKGWQERYCSKVVDDIVSREESLSPEQESDLKFAIGHLMKRWPAFDERPRSSLEMTWAGMADKFLFNPFNRIFCSGNCTITPEMTTHGGKIIIVDFPLLEYGFETARLIQCMIKLTFQRAWLRRNLRESGNPVFLWQDEFQYFVTRRDNFFQQTCRGSRIANVCLTQNLLNLAEQLGEQKAGSKTMSFVGNLGLKVFMQQNDIETCEYAANQIGKEYRYLEGYSGGGGQDMHTSVSGNKHLVHIVEPVEFTRLRKPDSDDPYAEAIIYQSGRAFSATRTAGDPVGRNWIRVMFSREI